MRGGVTTFAPTSSSGTRRRSRTATGLSPAASTRTSGTLRATRRAGLLRAPSRGCAVAPYTITIADTTNQALRKCVATSSRLDANRTNGEALAPAREGLCLFQGLLICGLCGRHSSAKAAAGRRSRANARPAGTGTSWCRRWLARLSPRTALSGSKPRWDTSDRRRSCTETHCCCAPLTNRRVRDRLRSVLSPDHSVRSLNARASGED
jgi:hypothetical protein